MKVNVGDVVTTDFGLPDGAEPVRAATWALHPPNLAAVRFEDEHRLNPLVSFGRQPGAVVLLGSVRAVTRDGVEQTHHRHLLIEISGDRSGSAELTAEVRKEPDAKAPQKAAKAPRADQAASGAPPPPPAP